MESNFIRVRSVKDIVIFASLIVVGIVLTILPEAEGANLGGYILITAGLVLALMLKSAFKDPKSKAIYHKKVFTFPGKMKATTLLALSSSPETLDLSEEGKGQVLMLNIYYSNDSGKAYAQLFEYIPHQYEPCSKVFEYEISKVKKLVK